MKISLLIVLLSSTIAISQPVLINPRVFNFEGTDYFQSEATNVLDGVGYRFQYSTNLLDWDTDFTQESFGFGTNSTISSKLFPISQNPVLFLRVIQST